MEKNLQMSEKDKLLPGEFKEVTSAGLSFSRSPLVQRVAVWLALGHPGPVRAAVADQRHPLDLLRCHLDADAELL
jgi:hypothetical protein